MMAIAINMPALIIGGGTANAAATDSGVRSSVIGTAIGATVCIIWRS